MALPESDKFVMSPRDEWIMSRVAPTTRDLGPILSCHLDEAIVLSAYLNGEITPEAAAQEITKPSVVHSRCYQLMNLFVYALRKLDQDTDMILGLLLAIQNLPSTESLYWWKLPGFGKLWQVHYNVSSNRNSKDPAFFKTTGILEAKMYLLDLYPVDESWVHRVLNLICLEKPNLEEVIYEIHAWLDIAGTKISERMQPAQIKSFERCVRGRRDKTYEIQVTLYEHWEHWKKRFLQVSYDEEYLSAGSREMSRNCYEIMKGLVVSPPNPPEDI
ncbi:hypothetical protein NW752_009207 [Fusarium irregulare]|uniref:Uncharacterized protein n=1 Tax=Fusarium irregulare TaxID=2494466 RepID=A0A9W8PKB4_9HYPO|nr:hypothetical protein NW766_008739 [Fusarium irregulare]KAJ4010030.1 hypothetical protein NW752_009207 [Fusarium irregulare]